MGLPKEYNKALHRHANFYAAWFPVAAPYTIGDYGLIQNGVFQKIGHLEDLRDDGFNVEIRTAEGPSASIDFLSEGAKSVKTIAGASVPELPAAEVEARLTYEFDKKNAFVVKAARLKVEEMQNIHEVAKELARLRREKKWSHKYRVVSATYTGRNCLVLLSREAGTKVEFEATARALKQLDMGNVEIKPSISFSTDTVLKSIGKTGKLGLKLFKLKWINLWGDDLKLLKDSDLSEEEQAVEEDWGNDLEDDDL